MYHITNITMYISLKLPFFLFPLLEYSMVTRRICGMSGDRGVLTSQIKEIKSCRQFLLSYQFEFFFPQIKQMIFHALSHIGKLLVQCSGEISHLSSQRNLQRCHIGIHCVYIENGLHVYYLSVLKKNHPAFMPRSLMGSQ